MSASQKYLPLDLRSKKTRAIRRQLTKHQVRIVAMIECSYDVTDTFLIRVLGKFASS